MSRVKPLNNRVLVKRTKVAASTGGILLPESAQEKSKEGEVVAVGAGRRDPEGKMRPLTVKEGDRVLFSSYAGTEVKDESDDEFLILAEEDILGILA